MTTGLGRAALTSVLFFVFGTGAPASELSGIVRYVCGPVLPGTAVSAANGSGAVVRVVADGQGRYLFTRLDPGQWNVTFELSGFRTERQDVRLPPSGDGVQHDVRLLPDLLLKDELFVTHGDPNVRYRKYFVLGAVRGPSGEAISAATVSLRDVGSGKSRVTNNSPCTTDESGRYALVAWSPTSTRWRLSVLAEGFRPYTHSEFELTERDPRVIDLRLEKR